MPSKQPQSPSSSSKPAIKDEQHSVKRKPKSFCRKVSSFLAIFFTSVLCLLAIIYSSPWGTQAIITLINKTTAISLTYKSGMFSEDLQFEEFRYQNDKVDIEATNLNLTFHLRCLWHNQFCINELTADSLTVITKPSDEDSEQKAPFEMPLGIDAERVYIKNTQIEVNTQHIAIIDLTSAVNIEGNTFTFNNTSANTTTVTSIQQESSNPTSDTQKNNQAQDIVLSEFNLPIKLEINALSIETLINNSSLFAFLPAQLNQTTLNLNWVEHDLYISPLTSNYAGGTFNINGKITFIDNYPLDAQLNHQLTQNQFWPEVNQSTQIVSLKGDLAELNTTIKSQGSLALEGDGSINVLTPNSPYRIKLEATKIPLYNKVSQHLHPSKFLFTSQGDINNQTIYLNSIISGLGYNQAQVSIKFDHAQSASTQSVNTPNSVKDVFTFNEVKIKDKNNQLNLSGEVALGLMPAWDIKVSSSGFTLPKFQGIDNEQLNNLLPSWVNTFIAGKYSGSIKGQVDSRGFYDKENSEISLSNTQLSGVVNNIPFSIKGDVDLNKNLQLQPSDLTLSV
ncbi:MAG: hypothetical protein ABJG28_04970, partial [Nonlabens ulvanivorans]|uniref:hypothetical protein n=1 Tax=Nonlabens ulvanivorans TaxID=906888 RepID=UPI0032644BD1